MTEGHVIPIPADPELEKMDKNTLTYRYKKRKAACILCFNTATRMLIYELEGCTKIERYCDVCITKVTTKATQSTSGI
jgi:hypothetical protein